MKTRIQLALVVLALLAAAPAGAAPAAPYAEEARPAFGIGVAIFPTLTAFSGSPVEVYAPIMVAPNFRIEPSLGIATNDRPAGQTDTRDVTLGVGAFYVKRVSSTVDVHLGGRLKLNFAKVTTPAGSDSGTDLVLAGAIGGEYYLVPRFSLGLEGDLGLFQNSRVSGDNSGLFTSGLAFLRLYF